MKVFLFLLISIIFHLSNSWSSIQNKIIVNVGNQIITSYELKNRIKTVLILSSKELNQLNVNKSKSEALNFLINSKLKKDEITKFNVLPNDKAVINHLDKLASSYKTDQNGLKKIFEDNQLSYDLFLESIEIEFAWQKFIYNFYSEKIQLDEKSIDKELNEIISNQKKSVEYKIAEIEILLEKNIKDKKKIEDIANQINQIGFKDTAIKYSSSMTSLEGGNIGWISSQSLSNLFLNELKKMNIGDISNPIMQADTATFIKLLDKRNIEVNKSNVEEIKIRIINKKRNDLLSLFSSSYLSKIKNTTLIQFNE
ncbi:MAG: hypothetical protein CMJ01_00125 [Pelagibacteraceae bacterium]|nr:hypothetical protein [Pelagibacteraceae bacterium]